MMGTCQVITTIKSSAQTAIDPCSDCRLQAAKEMELPPLQAKLPLPVLKTPQVMQSSHLVHLPGLLLLASLAALLTSSLRVPASLQPGRPHPTGLPCLASLAAPQISNLRLQPSLHPGRLHLPGLPRLASLAAPQISSLRHPLRLHPSSLHPSRLHPPGLPRLASLAAPQISSLRHPLRLHPSSLHPSRLHLPGLPRLASLAAPQTSSQRAQADLPQSGLLLQDLPPQASLAAPRTTDQRALQRQHPSRPRLVLQACLFLSGCCKLGLQHEFESELASTGMLSILQFACVIGIHSLCNIAAGSSGGFSGSSTEYRSQSPAKAAPKQSAPSRPASPGFFGSSSNFKSQSPSKPAPKQTTSSRPASPGFFGSSADFKSQAPAKPASKQPSSPAASGTSLVMLPQSMPVHGSHFAINCHHFLLHCPKGA